MARKFDIHLQVLPEATQRDTFKFISFGFQSTIGVKGFQMLINQWLKCFLTPRKSDPIDLDYGTNFTTLIGSNLPIADAQDIVILAIDQCNAIVEGFQRDDLTLTASERLGNAQLINFVEDPSAPGFDAFVEIKNQALERLILNIPTLATV
jgi:hypothetical protein